MRIDADEVREIFRPLGYNGRNSDIYKRGCVKGVEILFDNCLKNKYHTIVDSTFASRSVVKRNIQSAIEINAAIFIFYIYQDPLVAWGFTKIREKEEGRTIKKEMFVSSLFNFIANVNFIKQQYKDRVEVDLVEKDIANKIKKVKFNIENLDNYLKIKYTTKTLRDKLYEQ